MKSGKFFYVVANVEILTFDTIELYRTLYTITRKTQE